jgi:hypothetical protein
MAKINVRSPYYVSTSQSGMVSASIDIYIYAGVKTTDRPSSPTYTLSSNAVNERVDFEIADLVKDYIEMTLSYVNSPSILNNVWVDYVVTRYFVNTSSAQPLVNLTAFYGYGYIQDGVNPQLGAYAALLTNRHIVKNASDVLRFPVDNSYNGTTVTFKRNGSVLNTETIVSSNNSYDQVEYFVATGVNTDIDEVIVTTGIKSQEFTVENIEECLDTPYRLTFVNRYGALQSLTMFKKSVRNMNTNVTYYKKNIVENGNYNLGEAQKSIVLKNANESLTLNSGFYPENNNDVFKELLLSEYVWIYYGSREIPCNIASSSISYKTSRNDKLINYTLDIEFANDVVQNIR